MVAYHQDGGHQGGWQQRKVTSGFGPLGDIIVIVVISVKAI